MNSSEVAGGDLTWELLGIEVLEEIGQLVEALGEGLVASVAVDNVVVVLVLVRYPGGPSETPSRRPSSAR